MGGLPRYTPQFIGIVPFTASSRHAGAEQLEAAHAVAIWVTMLEAAAGVAHTKPAMPGAHRLRVPAGAAGSRTVTAEATTAGKSEFASRNAEFASSSMNWKAPRTAKKLQSDSVHAHASVR